MHEKLKDIGRLQSDIKIEMMRCGVREEDVHHIAPILVHMFLISPITRIEYFKAYNNLREEDENAEENND